MPVFYDHPACFVDLRLVHHYIIIAKYLHIGDIYFVLLSLVRAERIELSSLAWKAGILAIIRRPRALPVLDDYNAKMLQYKVLAIT